MPTGARMGQRIRQRRLDIGLRQVDLAERVGISITNLSLLKTGKVKAVRFSTLEALCRELDCQPGDILEFTPDQAGYHRGRVAS